MRHWIIIMNIDNDNITVQKNTNYRHGHAIVKKGYYHTWQHMKQRCSNPKNKFYHRYGGRGISVCEEWLNIKDFSEWAFQNGWKDGLSLDRIDNDGNYCPDNCQWISLSENSRKKSTTKFSLSQANEIRIRSNNGESSYAMAKEFGVSYGTIWFIVNNFTHTSEGEYARKLKERDERNSKEKKGVSKVTEEICAPPHEICELTIITKGNDNEK